MHSFARRYGSDIAYRAGVGLVEDHNCVYFAGAVFRFDYFSSSNPTFGGATTGGCYTLAEWQAMGFRARSIEADPLLADVASGDFQLDAAPSCSSMGAFAR